MESIKIKDYMNVRPVTFKPKMSLALGLEKMLKAQQIGGPVVDDKNHIVGFLSEQDVLHKLLTAGYHCQSSDTVADCMRTDVVTVSPDDSIIDLAEKITLGKPKIYPVADRNGNLVGVVSRHDILRALSTQFKSCFANQL